MNKTEIANEMRQIQLEIVRQLEIMDGKAKFCEDPYVREEGGGGITMTTANGQVLEKGGVAFSEVFGPVSPVMKNQLQLNGDEFFATGVSIVLHPHHPFVPIIHMNIRYFELDSGEFWFGGGIDLTPHYIIDKNASIFHQRLKAICDKYNQDFYGKFKNWADDYFFLPHRNETRGVGGIFFDHQNDTQILAKDQWFQFSKELALNFPNIYKEQVELGLQIPFDDEHITWRNIRRGRYVEFNLVHDRGTKFGLLSGGRTESILMSLPPLANWVYQHEIAVDSLENNTLIKLCKGINWSEITD